MDYHSVVKFLKAHDTNNAFSSDLYHIENDILLGLNTEKMQNDVRIKLRDINEYLGYPMKEIYIKKKEYRPEMFNFSSEPNNVCTDLQPLKDIELSTKPLDEYIDADDLELAYVLELSKQQYTYDDTIPEYIINASTGYHIKTIEYD